MIETSLLFLVFNRPEATKIVFEEIRKIQPKRLYVAADGPRINIDNEPDLVSQVRKITTNVDWDCEVKTLFREKNLGCKNAVSSAITWFFENEDAGIILEDDCLPNQMFFLFCEELLKRYRSDERIVMISGNNFQNGHTRTSDSYYFSHYTHIWGWATWKRAWVNWDGSLSNWPTMKKKGILKKIGGGDESFERYWTSIFDKYYEGKIDTWDYPWLFSCWMNRGLTILPTVNLVTNIGFGIEATHTKSCDSNYEVAAKQIEMPLKHPLHVLRNQAADLYTDIYHYHIQRSKKRKYYKLSKSLDRLLNFLRGSNEGNKKF